MQHMFSNEVNNEGKTVFFYFIVLKICHSRLLAPHIMDDQRGQSRNSINPSKNPCSVQAWYHVIWISQLRTFRTGRTLIQIKLQLRYNFFVDYRITQCVSNLFAYIFCTLNWTASSCWLAKVSLCFRCYGLFLHSSPNTFKIVF